VLRVGTPTPQIVEVPRAGYETSTLDLGISLFERLHARALLIAEAPPYADPQGRADVLSPRQKHSLFNLVHQVLLREAGDVPLMVTQVRGLGGPAPAGAASLLAFQSGLQLDDSPSLLRADLHQVLVGMGLAPLEVSGQPSTAGYEVGSNAQARYLSATVNKEFAIVWVPPQTRRAFADPAGDRQQSAQFQSLGIETLSTPLLEHLTSQTLLRQPLPPELDRRLAHYVATRDVIALRQLQQDYQLARLLPPDSGQALLQIGTAAGVLALVNLEPLSQAVVVQPQAAPLAAMVQRFLESRAFMLRFGGEP
jgi:hypothetical protein